MTVAERRARLMPWLLAIGALVLVAWLVAEGELFGSSLSPATTDGGADSEADLLAGTAPDLSGPGLVGLGGPASDGEAEEAADVPRGTLTVRCLAPDGTPLCGAQVEVVPGPPVGSPHSPETTLLQELGVASGMHTAIADAHGVAVLDAVPMDGSYVARLRDPTHSGGLVWRSFSPDTSLAFALDSDGRSASLQPAVVEERDGAGATADRTAAVSGRFSFRIGGGWPSTAGAVAPVVTIRGPEVTLQQADGLPIEVRPIDVLRDRWRDDLPVSVTPSFAGLPSGGGGPCATWTRLLPGSNNDVSVSVGVAADGDTVASTSALGGCVISSAARALVAEVPVWPEADIRLVSPAVGATEPEAPLSVIAIVDGLPVPATRAEVGSAGAWRVRGVPHRPGAALHLSVRRGEEDLGVATGTLPARVGELLDLHPRPEDLPPRIAGWAPETISFGTSETFGRLQLVAGDGASHALIRLFIDRTETPLNLEFEEPDAPPPPATLTVIVQAPPGHRASDAIVRCGGRTAAADVRGAALFEDLAPGTYAVLIDGAGPSVKIPDITLEPGSRTEMRVDVPAPARVDVSVVDALGREVPFAELEVTQPSQLPWCDLDGTTQRIDPYVDARGRRTLRNLEAGTIGVTARQGGLRGHAQVEVTAGGRSGVRITIAPPAPPAPPAPLAAEHPADAQLPD